MNPGCQYTCMLSTQLLPAAQRQTHYFSVLPLEEMKTIRKCKSVRQTVWDQVCFKCPTSHWLLHLGRKSQEKKAQLLPEHVLSLSFKHSKHYITMRVVSLFSNLRVEMAIVITGQNGWPLILNQDRVSLCLSVVDANNHTLLFLLWIP